MHSSMKETKAMEHRISVIEKIQNLQPFAAEACIFRVHAGLRNSKPEAYKPMLVSIGPYHHGDRQLPEMGEYKLLYLRSFLEGMDAMGVERIMQEMKKNEAEARKFYAEPIGLESNEFLEMMLLDACFVIEFIRKFCETKQPVDDPIFKVDWMVNQICRDLILLENQLPYFVLSELYNMTQDHTSEDQAVKSQHFMSMAMDFFPRMLPKLCPISKSVGNSHQIKHHLLEVLHILCGPLLKESRSKGATSNISSNINSDSDSDNELLLQVHNVTELYEAGVKFAKDGKTSAGIGGDNLCNDPSLFKINFGNSLLVIPSLLVEDSTETTLRNLIAYEQQTSGVHPRYISDYIYIMDHLINTEKDVGLLRQSGIIVNLLGDDKQVAGLFNSLGHGVSISPSTFYYLDEYRKLNQHCKMTCNKNMARLRHDYFYSPWAIVSVIAAGVLLLLTITQTIAALLSL